MTLQIDKQTKTSDPKAALQQPPLYQVLLLNDDYTPMDFVVFVLKRFFNMSDEQAQILMWDVHHKGQAVCGVFTRDVAETKVVTTNDFSRSEQHPLLCTMRPLDN